MTTPGEKKQLVQIRRRSTLRVERSQAILQVGPGIQTLVLVSTSVNWRGILIHWLVDKLIGISLLIRCPIQSWNVVTG